MKRKILKIFSFRSVSLAAALVAGAAHAENTNIAVQYTGGTYTDAGYYVGPYTLILNHTVLGQQTVQMVCMNFTNDITGGQSWAATISTFDDISLTRNPSARRQYQEAAWLYNYGVAQNNSDWGNVNYAIWAIFSPYQTELSGGWNSDTASLLAEAQSQTFTPNEFTNLAILTPLDHSGSGPQEFIGVIPGYAQPVISPPSPGPVPEPANYFGLSLAAAVIGMVYQRRRAA